MAERARLFFDRWKGVTEAVLTAFLVLFSALLYRANSDYARTARNTERPWLGGI
jgi:hypothetical protein